MSGECETRGAERCRSGWEAFKYRYWPATREDLDEVASAVVQQLRGASPEQLNILTGKLAQSTNNLQSTVNKIKGK